MDTGVHGNKPTQQEKQGSTKTCSKCKETKAVTEFSKRKEAKDGLRSNCKACNRESCSRWRAANKEEQAAYKAAWRAANPDYMAEWYAANKEEQAAYNAAWRAANRDKRRASNHRRRARKANAQGDHTAEDWKQKLEYYGYRCRYCNIRKEDTPEGWLEADHAKPLVLGGSNWISNIVPACKSCNCSKGAKPFKEFMEQVNGE